MGIRDFQQPKFPRIVNCLQTTSSVLHGNSGRTVKISLPGSANAAEQMNALQAQGKGELDFISVLTLYEMLAGMI
ncbi:MAG: hypothetical protein NT070_21370 [Cyanobacteria bacterium]|nr:hypothetical protein [Cyanobacteriota bacterium]